MPNKYILLVTGLAFLIVWLLITHSAIMSESTSILALVLPLPFIQALTFTLITGNNKVGAVILSLMLVSGLLSVTLYYRLIPNFDGIFLVSFSVFLVFLLTAFGSAILHIVYGFVKKERKTLQVGYGAPIKFQ